MNQVKQDFMFGMGEGHLPRRAAHLAEAHGAKLVNHTEPGGRKRHWFVTENLGAPYDEHTAKEVLESLRTEKLIA